MAHHVHIEECIKLLLRSECNAHDDANANTLVCSLDVGPFSVLALDTLGEIARALLDVSRIAHMLKGVEGHSLLRAQVQSLCHLAQTCRGWHVVVCTNELILLAEARARLSVASIPCRGKLLSDKHPFLEQLVVEESTARQLDMLNEAGVSMALHCARKCCASVRAAMNERWEDAFNSPNTFFSLVSKSKAVDCAPGLSVLWNTKVCAIDCSSPVGYAIVHTSSDESETFCSILSKSMQSEDEPCPWHPSSELHVSHTIRMDSDEGAWCTDGVMMSMCGTFLVAPQNRDDGTNRFTRFLICDTRTKNPTFRVLEFESLMTDQPVNVHMLALRGVRDDTHLVAYMDDAVRGEGIRVRVDVDIGRCNYIYDESNLWELAYQDNCTINFTMTLDYSHAVITYIDNPSGQPGDHGCRYRLAVLDVDASTNHYLEDARGMAFNIVPVGSTILPSQCGHPTLEIAPNADLLIVEYNWKIQILRRTSNQDYTYEHLQEIDIKSLLRSLRIHPYANTYAPFWTISPCGSKAVCTFLMPGVSKCLRCLVDIDLHGSMEVNPRELVPSMNAFHTEAPGTSYLHFPDWRCAGMVLRMYSGCLLLT